MSLKHYDHRKPHLTSAFEILEADFEMQEDKWMRSHAIALQKTKLRLIGMQNDDD